MNTAPIDFYGSMSALVSTDQGVGFWDAARRELRLTFGTHVYPKPKEMRPATDLEVRLFYSIRHATKKRLCEYYNGRGRNWSGD